MQSPTPTGGGAPVNPPEASVNPPSLDFGDVMVGSTLTLSSTVRNSGAASLTVTAIQVTGAGFSLAPITLPVTVGPSQTLSFQIRFQPAGAGSATGTASILSNDPTSPDVLTLAGRGVAQTLTLSATPSSINFGSVTVGSRESRTITLTSTGNTTVNITSAAVSGPGFSINGLALPRTLSPGETVSFNAVFAPATTGGATGNVSVTSNATPSPTVITFTGTGQAAAAGTLTMNLSSINFGSAGLGLTAARTVTLTSTGSSAVNVTGISLSGSTTFTISGISTPLTLNPGSSATLTVNFQPVVIGLVKGSVYITSNAAHSPHTISMQGTGRPQLALLWNPSPGAAGYNLYRAAVSRGPYTKLNSALIRAIRFTDSTAVSGQTYFYVATAVDALGKESGYSNELRVTAQ